MERLFICEKPSQGKDIAKVLCANKSHKNYIEGNNVKVTWCIGHLLQQSAVDFYKKDIKPWAIEKLPVIPESWHMEEVPRTAEQLNVVKKLIKEATHIVIATDADREGEVIARELLDICQYRGKIERLWLSALDEGSIKKALDNIRDGSATEKLYHAGLARQRADWLFGMNLTMAATVLFSNREIGTLSTGRVQTPTLGLVVKRDREIENFKSKDYFELFATFSTSSNEPVCLKWQVPEEAQGDDEKRCLDENIVNYIANMIDGEQGVVTKAEKKEKKSSAPLPFSLSELQKKCSALYGYSVKETLEIAQSLYETHKATSYPRTDCGHLPTDQFSEAKAIFTVLSNANPYYAELIALCDLSFKSIAWNDKKITAHHGIIPTTNPSVDVNRMSEKEQNVYRLICQTYLAQFMGFYKYLSTTIEVTCEDELFRATGQQPLELAWKRAFAAMELDEKENGDSDNKLFPPLNVSDTLTHSHNEIATKKTKPPSRYTEGTLVDAMKSIGKFVQDVALKKILRENSGIGTEATRADILDKLISRNYLNKTEKHLISTDKGRALIDTMPDLIKNPETTAVWEQLLDDIALGNFKLNDFMVEQEKHLQNLLSTLKSVDKVQNAFKKIIRELSAYSCPSCNEPLLKRKSNKTKRDFWGCSGYPNCSVALPDVDGKPGELREKIVQPAGHDVNCPKCSSGKLLLRKSKRGMFWGCSTYPTCKTVVADRQGTPCL